MFLSDAEQVLSKEYLKQGYVIRSVADLEALDWIRNKFTGLLSEILGTTLDESPEHVLNQIHKRVSVSQLNTFRLKVIQGINAIEDFRSMYFRMARPYLETLVGNELAMQLRVNLSIQFPNDDSSLLPVHADTWSGDSPYEVVVWLPLVDCYGTKAMYLLPPKASDELKQQFASRAGNTSEDLYRSIQQEVKFLEVRYGEVLLFDQGLPHGNRVNDETETRWSMNCRFKGVFTPYGDKKIGEFFEPITLRAASRAGMAYRLPDPS
ncbi:MAG: sporadic carbohydrate cluster 2OG-Fe(II) oxygenase [Pseudomonadota bacterium]